MKWYDQPTTSRQWYRNTICPGASITTTIVLGIIFHQTTWSTARSLGGKRRLRTHFDRRYWQDTCSWFVTAHDKLPLPVAVIIGSTPPIHLLIGPLFPSRFWFVTWHHFLQSTWWMFVISVLLCGPVYYPWCFNPALHAVTTERPTGSYFKLMVFKLVFLFLILMGSCGQWSTKHSQNSKLFRPCAFDLKSLIIFLFV